MRLRRRHPPSQPPRRDLLTPVALARLEAVTDRLEGAYAQLLPLLRKVTGHDPDEEQ